MLYELDELVLLFELNEHDKFDGIELAFSFLFLGILGLLKYFGVRQIVIRRTIMLSLSCYGLIFDGLIAPDCVFGKYSAPILSVIFMILEVQNV